MNIEVIALDLDGTALCADHLSFSPRHALIGQQIFIKFFKIIPTIRKCPLTPPIPVLSMQFLKRYSTNIP